MSVIKFSKFSTLFGVGTAVTATIGGGYLVVRKVKKANTDISVVDAKEEVNFSSYDINSLKVDEKIKSTATFIDKIIKLNESNVRVPAGTSFSDINQINDRLLENKSVLKDSEVNIDDLKNDGDSIPTEDLSPTQDVVDVTTEGETEQVEDSEPAKSDEGTSKSKESEPEKNTNTDEGKSETEKDDKKDSTSEEGENNQSKNQEEGGNSITEGQNNENLDEEDSSQALSNNSNQESGNGNGNSNDETPDSEKKYVESIISDLNKSLGSNKDAAPLLSILQSQQENIIKWLKLKK